MSDWATETTKLRTDCLSLSITVIIRLLPLYWTVCHLHDLCQIPAIHWSHPSASLNPVVSVRSSRFGLSLAHHRLVIHSRRILFFHLRFPCLSHLHSFLWYSSLYWFWLALKQQIERQPGKLPPSGDGDNKLVPIWCNACPQGQAALAHPDYSGGLDLLFVVYISDYQSPSWCICSPCSVDNHARLINQALRFTDPSLATRLLLPSETLILNFGERANKHIADPFRKLWLMLWWPTRPSTLSEWHWALARAEPMPDWPSPWTNTLRTTLIILICPIIMFIRPRGMVLMPPPRPRRTTKVIHQLNRGRAWSTTPKVPPTICLFQGWFKDCVCRAWLSLEFMKMNLLSWL